MKNEHFNAGIKKMHQLNPLKLRNFKRQFKLISQKNFLESQNKAAGQSIMYISYA